MSENSTIQNLTILQRARNGIREQLAEKYEQTVIPFMNIIKKVSAANNENYFEAIERMKNETDWLRDEKKMLLFSCALIELVENEKTRETPQPAP